MSEKITKLPWLRLYTKTIDNDQLRLLAFEDRWHFVSILCLKRTGIIDSNIDSEMLHRRIAVKLGLSTGELSTVKKRIMDVDLIDNDFQPITWDEHQYNSDSSTERVRKFRKNKKLEQ